MIEWINIVIMLVNRLALKITEILFCFPHNLVAKVGMINFSVPLGENSLDWDLRVCMHENLDWD